MIDSELWIVTHGYRRAFHHHTIYFNKKNQEYAFHVSDGDLYDYRHDGFPNFGRYPTYDEMIDGVVDKYSILWKISD